jgi:hypothetical protein
MLFGLEGLNFDAPPAFLLDEKAARQQRPKHSFRLAKQIAVARWKRKAQFGFLQSHA